jgi:hypothetical protein
LTLVTLPMAANVQFTHLGNYGAADPNPRPFVEVEIAATGPGGVLVGKPITTAVLVDSGADATMLDGALGTTLGIDLASCPQYSIGGIGAGGVPVAKANVKMQFCGRWFDVPANFTLDPIQNPQLLGRLGAFEGIVWAFVHSQAVVLALAT